MSSPVTASGLAREVNPRLGSSFAILASAYVSLIVLLIIFEELGLQASTIDRSLIIGPPVIYFFIGFLTRTSQPDDYFVSGQRVPAFYNAMAICTSVFGGAIFAGSIGSLFFLGIDAIAIPLGCLTGLVLMGLLFVPFWRKAGAYTLPGFFYLRFGRYSLRALTVVLIAVPCFMLLSAEISIGQRILTAFLPLGLISSVGLQGAGLGLLLAGLIAATILFGGMRSATWTACAQFIVFICLLGPLVTVSVSRAILPLPQLTYGGQLEQIKAFEASKTYVTTLTPQRLGDALPRPSAAALVRPAERAFSAISSTDFSLLVLSLALGVAVFPGLLPRLSMTPNIQAARRTMGWTTVLGGFILVTIPAYAFFLKAMAVEGLVGVPASDIPGWVVSLQDTGIFKLAQSQFDQLGTSLKPLFQRDTIVLMLPVAGRLPRALLGVVGAATISVVCACASAQLIAIGNAFGDDLLYGRGADRNAASVRRISAARVGVVLVVAGLAFANGSLEIDPLKTALFAFGLAGSTFFVAVTLSIWWRRFHVLGAMAGMIAGFSVAAFMMFTGGVPLFGIDALTAPAVAIPVSFAVSVAVSLMAGAPGDYALEALEDLRVPAGETLQSRMLRLAARPKPKSS